MSETNGWALQASYIIRSTEARGQTGGGAEQTEQACGSLPVGPSSAAAHAAFFLLSFSFPPATSDGCSPSLEPWTPRTPSHSRVPGRGQPGRTRAQQQTRPTNDSFLRARPSPQPSVSRRPFCGNVLRSSRRLLPSPAPLDTSSSLSPPHRSPLFIPHRRSDAKLLLFLRLPLVPPGSVSPGVEDPAFLAACGGGCWLFLGSCTTGKRGRRGGGELGRVGGFAVAVAS